MFKALGDSLARLQLKRAQAIGPLLCPACGEPGVAGQLDPGAVVACRVCHHPATVEEWAANTLRVAEHYGQAGDPPEGTAIRGFVTETERSWEIPPSGRIHFQLVVGWLWTLFLTGFTAFVGYGVTTGETQQLSKPVVLLILGLFLTPFWALGLFLLYQGDRRKNALHRLTINHQAVRLTETWRGRTKTKSLPLEQIEHVQRIVPIKGQSFAGVEIRGGTTRLRFGNDLSKAEKNWLVAECKAAVWPVRTVLPAPPLAVSPEPVVDPSPRRFSLQVPASRPTLGTCLWLFCLGAFISGLCWVMFRHGWSWETHTPVAIRIFEIVMTVIRAAFALVFTTAGGFLLLAAGHLAAERFRHRDVEQWLEGTNRGITLRKSRKGLLLSEQVFPHGSFQDIRAKVAVTSGNSVQKRLELLIDGRSIPLAHWANGAEADAFVQAVRQAMR